MNWYTRHPRLMQRFLAACRSSPAFMSIAELAERSDTSSKRAMRFIRVLEANGYVFRRRVTSDGVTEYRLIVEPLTYRDNQFHRINTLNFDTRL